MSRLPVVALLAAAGRGTRLGGPIPKAFVTLRGRSLVERSLRAMLTSEVVDEVIEVTDAASVAAMHLLEEQLGRRCGGSSGTNLVACLELAARMRAAGEHGSIVSLLCDPGERYDQTLYDPAWLAENGIDPAPAQAALRATLATGEWHPPA